MERIHDAIDILMVDDNPGDARLTLEALKEACMPHRFRWFSEGDAALSFLKKEGEHRQATPPDLILLDLNLPRTDGREVLAQIKSDPALRMIPVIVLTTSHTEEDINRAYHLAANCYLRKPVRMDQFFAMIRAVKHFWAEVAILPSSRGKADDE